ncbi:FMN-dependent NADH-azoreductase [Acinetobacter bereziniae]|uniref:FMN dependent NADH:quinone oxidoreductase n=1 Tax=Acinetobacter bereziniae NIPH 3 TaxID=1217651 RepID=N8X8W0_ACIBZ|nr:NAD(P)H-dependent oxidoreductase [Acinetobacter bereziniae]ENV20716.1 hypothetical protein F963_03298 [Acinetobacter bereziniae NIPH 3]
MVERVLYVSASPRGKRSLSSQIAEDLLIAFGTQKEIEIDHLDPWKCNLPEVDGDLLAAKYAGLAEESLSPEQIDAWNQIKELAQRFYAADILLFSVPLWNFGIPYKLKHLIDVISHKGILFSFDGSDLSGLLGGRRAIVIYTRGLGYDIDSQTPDDCFGLEKLYLDTWFQFVGVTKVHSLVVENTLGSLGSTIRNSSNETVNLLMQSVNSDVSQSIVLGRDKKM